MREYMGVFRDVPPTWKHTSDEPMYVLGEWKVGSWRVLPVHACLPLRGVWSLWGCTGRSMQKKRVIHSFPLTLTCSQMMPRGSFIFAEPKTLSQSLTAVPNWDEGY